MARVVDRATIRASEPSSSSPPRSGGGALAPGVYNPAIPHSAGEHADDALGVMQQASLAQQVATERKPVKKVKRTQVLGGKERALGPNCASYDGYNLHAGVHLDAMDRTGLERLCRYVLRPPLALPRLERFQGVDGRTMVRIEMKRTYSDGTHGSGSGAPTLTGRWFPAAPAA